MKSIIIFLAVLLFSSCDTNDRNLYTDSLKFQLTARLQSYERNKVVNDTAFRFIRDQALLQQSETIWRCLHTEKRSHDNTAHTFTFQLEKGEAKSTGVVVNFLFEEWTKENYVIMPAAAYSGNRFDVLDYSYPPLFKKEDYKVDMPITITHVPGLNKYAGKSRLDLNTGDLSTPSIGIYFPKVRKGIWIVTEQATEVGNSGLILKEHADRTKAEFTISAPCVRKEVYTMTKLSASDETGIDWEEGDQVTIRCKVFVFDDMRSPSQLIKEFLSVRKSYGTTSHIDRIPFSEAFNIMENQQNRETWDEKNGYYSLGGETWNSKWQLGWVGGCMITLPLTTIGKPLSKERSFQNYQTIITTSQARSGFFYSCSNGKDWCSDCFYDPHPDNLLLLRKNADAFYFFYKYCLAQKTIDPGWQMPGSWKQPLERLADAFVTLWKRYGQFGQFIDIETGEIKVGGTNSAATAIGGLALASQYENRPGLLQIAKEAARYYYREFIAKGISCGGPGEILQCSDSESAFATLESLMVLYETTGEKEWLDYAEDAAALCATWVVSYDYKFPQSSLFGQLDMRTTGATWANIQNKHGGPGICTMSGDCLFKLYRATGKRLYLELAGDIAHNIMQYISREDRPIKDQHPGWINERVNLSDWEGKEQVGGIFHGNTWAQVAAMLTVAEIPGIYIDPAKKELFVFDHVEALLEGNQIKITNPTKFDAKVKIFIDRDPSKPYPQGYVSQCPEIEVSAGTTITYPI